jgi:hypothetical protein
MNWLRWFTIFNLSSFLMLVGPVHGAEMDYFAKVKAVQAKTDIITNMQADVVNRFTVHREELSRQETQANEVLKQGQRSRGQSQNTGTRVLNNGQVNPDYNPYHDYMERAQAYHDNPNGNSTHNGEYRYDADGNSTLANSSKEQVAKNITDPVERKKFEAWADSVDPALKEKSRIAVARQEMEDFKKTLNTMANSKSIPLSQSDYDQLSRQLSKMGLPEAKYNEAVQALEKAREKTPGLKPYPHGQKNISASCLLKGL